METRRGFRLRGVVLAIVALGVGAAIWYLARGGNAYVFRFGPPDGTRFVATRKSTVIYSTQGGRKWKQVRDSRTSGVIAKTPSGYRWTLTSVFARSVEQGVPNRMVTIYKGIPVYLDFDRRGSLTSVSGLNGLEQAYERVYRRKPRPRFIALVRRSSLASARADWWSRMSTLAGRSVCVGDIWNAAERYSLGGVILNIPVRQSVVGTEQHGGRTCLVVTSDYTGDPKELARQANREGERSGLAMGSPFRSLSITGATRRVIAPDGMFLYRESRDITVRKSVNDPISPYTMQEHEGSLVTFDYARPKRVRRQR